MAINRDLSLLVAFAIACPLCVTPLLSAAERPYELVDAGRVQDAHAAFEDFEKESAWQVRCENAVAEFSRSQDCPLFGDWTGRLVYRADGSGGVPRVALIPPAPVPVPEGSDTFSAWIHRTSFGRGANTDPSTPAPALAAVFAAPSGASTNVSLGRIDWMGWHLLIRRVSPPDGMSFNGFVLTGGTQTTDRVVHFDSIAFFREELRPVKVDLRPKRNLHPLPGAIQGVNTGNGTLPFPVREETILPDVAEPMDGEPFAAFTGGAREGSDLSALKTVTRRVGRTLIVDMYAPAGTVTKISAGLASEAKWLRTVDVPYLAYDGDKRAGVEMLEGGLFRLALFDWYRSNATRIQVAETPRGRELFVVYEKKTDGTYNPVSERLFITLSPDFAGVLPNIPNPKSPWKHVAGRKVWRSHAATADRERDKALWRAVYDHGMREIVVTDHETMWRSGGESYTLRTNADPFKGGDAAQRDYTRFMCDELGFSYGPYNNYVEFAPVNANWDLDLAMRRADGSLVDAWMRTYALKPSAAPGLCEKIAPEVQRKFGFNTAYFDVHTAMAPWRRVDADARVPGAGTFSQTFYAWGETALVQRRTWNGPVWSEGAHQMFYAGLVDGNYGQDWGYRASERPWIVDFDLLKLHPLETDFGMGTLAMFAPGKTRLEMAYYLPNAPTLADRTNLVDRFIAATLAFGHSGYLVLDYLFDPPKCFGLAYGPPAEQKITDDGMAVAMKSYFMVQQIAARYTQSIVETIRYVNAEGRLVTTSEAVASGAVDRCQVCVRYRDGTKVVSNGSIAERLVVEFAGEKFDLPPRGYAARTANGDVVVESSDAGGSRADYCESPDYIYIDGRGTEASRPKARASGTALCRPLTNGWEIISLGGRPCSFLIGGEWRSFTFNPGESRTFLPRQPAAEVRVEPLVLTTYPFSEPDPVPCAAEKRYPYFRFDGSTDVPELRSWTSVVLENDRVKITILPEIGGKVWGAVDKATGLDFIYFNHAVKFRDIAMRGPWCSGGIEFNFGITGHAPTTATPVDWCVRTNSDGSASCFVSATEHINRTTWQVETRLYPGADSFVTRATWFNGSNIPGPYYQWSTAAYPTRGNPHLFFPGRAYIGHCGDAHDWPINPKGRDLSVYSNNAFGFHKSYHVLNGDNRIFAAWWPDAKFGSYHANAVYDKFGRKIWLWALSREGGIWEDLLTDSDGQYIELQSGRVFHQPQGETWKTPFKHPTFAPGAVDTFDEKWGVTRDMSELERKSTPSNLLERPLHSPTNFNWSSAYGLYLKGEQALRCRSDREGDAVLRECLSVEPFFVPALDALAGLCVRRGQYQAARELAARALSVNTYDYEANYLDGLASFALGDLETAKERLGLAAYSPAYRSPAMVMIAKARMRAGHWNEARAAAERCLRADPMNPDAHLIRIASLRMAGDKTRAAASARLLLVQWPLHHAANWELERLGVAGVDFLSGIRNELPLETIIDVAGWYEEAGLVEDALALLALAPKHPVARIRAAYLLSRADREQDASAHLAAAAELPVDGVSPFRRESRPALMWAAEKGGSWKFKYLAAVFLASAGEDSVADALLDECGEQDDLVLRLFRASRREGSARLADLLAARKFSDSWRVGNALAKYYQSVEDAEAMLEVTSAFTPRHPNVQSMKLLHATALLLAERIPECCQYLEGVTILPAENSGNARDIWVKAWTAAAREALKRADIPACDEALRKLSEWPENIGAGKPYPKED
jgi:tetratricopeptide (TPR) repeat protein